VQRSLTHHQNRAAGTHIFKSVGLKANLQQQYKINRTEYFAGWVQRSVTHH